MTENNISSYYEPYNGNDYPRVKRAVDQFAREKNPTLKTFSRSVWYFTL